jgi:2'-5' RNA ligase
MGYAVELYFDPQTEKNIDDLRQVLKEAGIPSKLGGSGDRPHISLAGFSNVDRDVLISLVQNYAYGLEQFSVQLSAVGVFPADENVLFLSPVPTLQLLHYHQEFHQRLIKSNLVSSPYYAPGNWVPHCSIEINIPREKLPQVIELCTKAFKPMLGQFEGIGVIEFWPIQQLSTWPLELKASKE